MNYQHANPIFITGMYKSGTTWLLSILAEHPDVKAFREIDTVRAYFDGSPGSLQPRDHIDRAKHFFTRYPYFRANEEQFARMISMDTRFDALVQQNESGQGPQTFNNLSPQAQRDIVDLVLGAEDYPTLLRGFASINQGSSRRVVFKSADQLPVCHKIREVFDHAKQVVIIRDGRDAAVSARHFRDLMRKRAAPWLRETRDVSIEELFRGWRNRIRILKDLLRTDGGLYVIRYEDLKMEFHATISRLLEWCELTVTSEMLSRMEAVTSFKNTTGREPGEAAEHVVRKGIVGDFKNELTLEECSLLWKLGGAELTEFGYSEDGTVQSVSLASR